MSGYGQPLLLDNSAWARAIDGRLSGPQRKRFDEALVAGELWSCPPTLLEMLYSARNDGQFTIIKSELGALRHALLSANAAEQALTAQAQLAATPGVSHRVAPVDLLIAAIASTTELGVLHYDHDYDTIAQHTTLTFGSIWVAPRGSID